MGEKSTTYEVQGSNKEEDIGKQWTGLQTSKDMLNLELKLGDAMKHSR